MQIDYDAVEQLCGIEFRSRPFPGKLGPLVTTPYVNMAGYELARLGDLGKVKLTADQKAQVKAAAQAALVQKKIAKSQAGAAKAQYKQDLKAAKRSGKLALIQAKYDAKIAKQQGTASLYAPAASDPIAAASAANSAFDYSSIIPQSYQIAPSSGGGGGGSGANFSSDEAPAAADAGTDTGTNYLPWLIGGGAVLVFFMVRK